MGGDILRSYYSQGDEDDLRKHGEYVGFGHISSAALKFCEWHAGEADLQLEEAIQEAIKRGEVINAEIRNLIIDALLVCESPIEKRIFPWLALQRYQFFNYPPLIPEKDKLRDLAPFSIAVIPQLTIGKFRVDFGIVGRLDGPLKALLIECDGKDYHQDKERDSWRESILLRKDKVLGIHRIQGFKIRANAQLEASHVARSVLNAWSKVRA